MKAVNIFGRIIEVIGLSKSGKSVIVRDPENPGYGKTQPGASEYEPARYKVAPEPGSAREAELKQLNDELKLLEDQMSALRHQAYELQDKRRALMKELPSLDSANLPRLELISKDEAQKLRDKAREAGEWDKFQGYGTRYVKL